MGLEDHQIGFTIISNDATGGIISSQRGLATGPTSKQFKVQKAAKGQTTVRVKSGCFCCRKRKKKCDEKQPICSGCKRNYLKCVYPSYVNQILPKNFEIESENVMFQNKETLKELKKQQAVKEESALTLLSNDDQSLPTIAPFVDSNTTIDFSQLLMNPITELSSFSQWIPNVQMTEIDSELYFHFIHQFMPSVSPSHSHPNLSPKEIWIPLASQSEILREIFFSCGATQLAYKYPEYQNISIQRYNRSVRMISDQISSKAVDGTEDWLLAAILTLCLRDRALGYNGTRCAQHLVAAYKIIHERERQKLSMLPKINLSADGEIPVVSGTGFSVTPSERTLIESFIFNYCIVLYTCSYENLIKLPSPFTVFPEMIPWLNAPLYDNVPVSWMNNPILGSSLKEFEIISKLIWLLRFHYCVDFQDPHYIEEDKFWKLITSLKVSLDDIETTLYDGLAAIETAENRESLRTSLSVTFIMFYASKILLQKLVNPSLPASFPLIQESVEAVIRESQMIPEYDHSACLCVLGIFIAGAACIKEEDKQIMSRLLVDLSDLLCSNYGLNVLGILQRSWNREEEERILKGDAGYKSFGLLFNREEVEAISF